MAKTKQSNNKNPKWRRFIYARAQIQEVARPDFEECPQRGSTRTGKRPLKRAEKRQNDAVFGTWKTWRLGFFVDYESLRRWLCVSAVMRVLVVNWRLPGSTQDFCGPDSRTWLVKRRRLSTTRRGYCGSWCLHRSQYPGSARRLSANKKSMKRTADAKIGAR